MAILEATLTQSYYNQLVINRWHYVSEGATGAVSATFGLMSAMGFIPPTASPWRFTANSLADFMQALQSNALEYKALYIRNLYDPTDFIETAYNPNVKGIAAGEACSPVLAYAVRSNRVRTDIRRGSKRFGGVVESNVGAGGTVVSEGATYLAAVASVMSNTLSYTDGGASLTFKPTVLGLQEYTTPAGNRAYRTYATEAQQLDHAASGVTFTPVSTVRSQVSRQYGSGA